MTIVYLTSSSMQSTRRSRFELGIMRLPSSSEVNCVYAFGTELWLGIANMRIQRPRIRSEFTALNDCDPPLTCATARVLPWVGRTAPDDNGIQSICCLKIPVFGATQVSHFIKLTGPSQSMQTYQVAVLL